MKNALLAGFASLALLAGLAGAAQAQSAPGVIQTSSTSGPFGNPTTPIVNVNGTISAGISGGAAQSSQTITGTGAQNIVSMSLTNTAGVAGPSLTVPSLSLTQTATGGAVVTAGGNFSGGIVGGYSNSQGLSATAASNAVVLSSTGLPGVSAAR